MLYLSDKNRTYKAISFVPNRKSVVHGHIYHYMLVLSNLQYNPYIQELLGQLCCRPLVRSNLEFQGNLEHDIRFRSIRDNIDIPQIGCYTAHDPSNLFQYPDSPVFRIVFHASHQKKCIHKCYQPHMYRVPNRGCCSCVRNNMDHIDSSRYP